MPNSHCLLSGLNIGEMRRDRSGTVHIARNTCQNPATCPHITNCSGGCDSPGQIQSTAAATRPENLTLNQSEPAQEHMSPNYPTPAFVQTFMPARNDTENSPGLIPTPPGINEIPSCILRVSAEADSNLDSRHDEKEVVVAHPAAIAFRSQPSAAIETPTAPRRFWNIFNRRDAVVFGTGAMAAYVVLSTILPPAIKFGGCMMGCFS